MARVVQQKLTLTSPIQPDGNVLPLRSRKIGSLAYLLLMQGDDLMELEKIISVIPGLTHWSVRERELDNPVAYFTTCTEAVKYAKAIAETKRRAVVRILDKNGKTTSEQRFDMRLG